MRRAAAISLGLASLMLCGGTGLSVVPAAQRSAAAVNDAWRTFNGSWSALGRRQTIPTEGGGTAAVVYLSGAVVIAKGSNLGDGLLGEAIAFDDGRNLSTGRAVWTDTRGDRIFSQLSGEPVAAGRRIVGTITGGTGRFAGVVGEYELTWQYVARDDDQVQGRAVDLRGRLRKESQP